MQLSAAEQTVVTSAGGTFRSGSTARDQLGESFGVSQLTLMSNTQRKQERSAERARDRLRRR